MGSRVGSRVGVTMTSVSVVLEEVDEEEDVGVDLIEVVEEVNQPPGGVHGTRVVVPVCKHVKACTPLRRKVPVATMTREVFILASTILPQDKRTTQRTWNTQRYLYLSPQDRAAWFLHKFLAGPAAGRCHLQRPPYRLYT